MKFARTLQAGEGVYSQYVVYKVLKEIIKKIEKIKGHAESITEEGITATQLWFFDSTDKAAYYTNGKLTQQQMDFLHTLEAEISRVRRIHTAKIQELKDLLTDVFGRIQTRVSPELLLSEINSVAEDLIKLDRFNRQSKVMFYKILKKYDKKTGMRAGAWTLARLEREDFWNCRFDPIVIALSDAYSEVRALEKQEADPTKDLVKVADDVETFERQTEKYFVRPEDIMTVKLIIIKRLPLDIFGRKKSSTGVDFTRYVDSLNNFQDSSVINSVYLDNDKLQMYHERTGIDTPRGNLIRVRWYGDFIYPPAKVFMERKTRLAGLYDVDSSVKERFLMKEANMIPYLKGDWNPEEKLNDAVAKGKLSKEKAEKLKTIALDIQSEIVSKTLRSAVRTVCRRSAFQVGKDQTLRFSLDTNLHMIDEVTLNLETKWYRNLDKPLKEHEVIKFPFAVLEIKTQKEPPQWVIDLKNSGLITLAERFSKFQYGTIRLRPQRLRFLPLWFENVDTQLKKLNEPENNLVKSNSSNGANHLHFNNGSVLVKSAKQEIKRDASNSSVSTVVPDAHDLSDDGNDTIELRTPKNKRKPNGDLSELVSMIPVEKPNSPKVQKKVQSIQSKVAPEPKPKPVAHAPPPASAPVPFKGGGKTTQRTAKSFFANERTLLQWLNTVTFLSLTGLTLLNTDTLAGRISGVALVVVTILFASYALRRYKQRLTGLESASLNGFQDKWGPVVLIVVFCFVLLGTAIFYILQDFIPSLKA